MLTATRWTRYGKDRVYVNDNADTRVGWIDLQSGRAVLDREEYSAEFDSIVAQHLPLMAPGSAPTPTPAPPMPPAWTAPAVDLAQNRAGEAVKARADEVRAEAPMRNLLARVLGVHTEERAWRVGAKGEAKVGKALDKLADGWRVLNSVPVGDRGSDIDHVVIWPGGVFTLNTKHHPGGRVWVAEQALMVNGQKTHYLRNSRHEAERASRLLSVPVGFHVAVEPIIVVVGADITRKADPDGVHVVPREALRRWLNKQRPMVSRFARFITGHSTRLDTNLDQPTVHGNGRRRCQRRCRCRCRCRCRHDRWLGRGLLNRRGRSHCRSLGRFAG